MRCRSRVFASCLVVAAACGGDEPENLPPDLGEDLVTVDEDATIAIAVLANDTDPEGRPLHLLRATAVGHEVSVDGDLVRVATVENWHGTIAVTYVVSDGDASASGRAVITVVPVNDAPVATAAAIATGRNLARDFQLAGSDVDGDALTFEIASGPAHGTLSGTAPALTYTPETGYVGEDTITFRARDAALASEPATIAITVAAGSPPVAQAQAVTTVEDTGRSITLAATDADDDPLTFEIVEQPAHGTLTGMPPELTYTPAADFHGADSFRFTAGDGVLTSSAATVAITVTPANDPPVAQAQSVAASEDLPAAITLTGTDPDGDPLTFTIVDGPARGTLTGTGAVRTYQGGAHVNGADSFTFTVSDGTATSAPATVAIDIAPVEDAPLAHALSVTTPEDTARAITLSGSDGDGDALVFTITSGPARGFITGTPPAITYIPSGHFHGSDAFTYVAGDGDQTSAPATVVITVSPVDDPPVLVGRSITGPEDEPITISLPATDVDGEPLTYTVATPPVHGVLVGTGATRQYLARDYDGLDTFALRASDGNTTTEPATFTVTVTPMPDAPIARDDVAIATPGHPLIIDVLANDDEVDGEVFFIQSVGTPTHGTAITDTEEIQFTGEPGNTAPATFTYTVVDSSGETATATVIVGIGEFPGGLARATAGKGADGQARQHDLSADGRYVVFVSDAALVAGDTNALPDVYLWDRLTGEREWITVATNGAPDGHSFSPSVSADGRRVAFSSQATNLVGGDTNGTTDVFVRDRVAGTTTRVSVTSGGAQASGASYRPVISDDGTVVAFGSAAFDLIPVDANGTHDIFVRDLTAGTTTRVSVRTGGGEGDGIANAHDLSGDGRHVAFVSAATNMVAGDTNAVLDVFVHDRATGITERVSVSSTGGEANGPSSAPAISRDGRFVAFRSNAGNLVPGGGGGTFVRDRSSPTTIGAAPYAASLSLSGDGRYLTGHLVDGTCYVRDRFAGTVHYFSSASGDDLRYPVLSDSGRYISLLSDAALLPDLPAGTNVFVYPNPL